MLPTGRRPTSLASSKTWATVSTGRSAAPSSPAPRIRHGLRGRNPSSSTAVISTARSSRYALAATDTETPPASSEARHSRIMAVDSLPMGTPPSRGAMCLRSSQRYWSADRGRSRGCWSIQVAAYSASVTLARSGSVHSPRTISDSMSDSARSASPLRSNVSSA